MTRHARATWAVSGAHSRKPRRIPYEPRLGDIGVIPPSSIASLSAVPLLYFSFRKARGRGVRWVGRRVLGGIGERGLPRKTEPRPKRAEAAQKRRALSQNGRGVSPKRRTLSQKRRGVSQKRRALSQNGRGVSRKRRTSPQKRRAFPQN